jgi:hypothetical protein
LFWVYGGILGLQENEGEWGRNGVQAVDYWIKIYFSKLS